MNEPERAELARLREQQARLERELKLLSLAIDSFGRRLDTAQTPQPPAPVVPTPQPIPQPPTPTATPFQPPPPPPLPGPIPPPSPEAARLITERPPPPRTEAPPPSPPPLLAPAAPPKPLSLEMRLGTFWFVRVGIVLVLGGLAFFAKLAYQEYISRLGPAGKVALLYCAGGLLLGAGWWWQRRPEKETLRNYGRVLFAGGLAALYFTTYAAHYLEPLQIISSRLLDGVLLLGCAGFMVWCADREQSEVLAMFAVGLAYFTSIITRIGYFTLYSNLVLTLAGVVFLVRNRWAMLSFGSLAATYAAYGFWRFFDGSSWHWASPAEGLWTGTCFLACYWVLFTAAVFLSRDRAFAGQNRSGFLTLNNGAFLTLFLLTMLQVQQGGFWKFALVYGAVLLGCAAAARLLLPAEPLARNAYLTQGLLLVTVGFIVKFSGLRLALLLGMESVVLLVSGQQRRNLVLLAGAYLTAGLSIGWGIDGLRAMEPPGLWLAAGLGGLMLVNTVLAHRGAPVRPGYRLRPEPSYFTVLALLIWLVASYDNTTREHLPLCLAVEAVLLTGSVYLLRVPEVALFSQGYLVLAQAAWCFDLLNLGYSPPGWHSALLVGLTLGLSHWWQKQKVVSVPPEFSLFCRALYALGLVGLVYFWLAPKCSASGWLALASLLGIVFTVYGVATRAWFIAAFGQIFTALSGVLFVGEVLQTQPEWYTALAPLAALGLLSGGTVFWFAQRPEASPRVSAPLLETARVYRWVALGMSLLWVWEYIPARERIWVLSLLGLVVFAGAGLRRNREALLFSGVFTAAALVVFWLPLLTPSTVYWPNLLAILALLGERQVACRRSARYALEPAVDAAVLLAGGLSLWLFVTRWVGEAGNTRYLTVCWSLLALALFAAGIVLRARRYRWLGLGILGCALVRVVVVDIWNLVALYRVLSLMALGVALLVLGFVYSKYQDKIKEWL